MQPISYAICVVYCGSMSEASRLAASAAYYCMLVSWALLLHTLPYVITPISTVYIIDYGLVNNSNIQHSLVHGQPLIMLCTGTYFVPWTLLLYILYVVYCCGHWCFVPWHHFMYWMLWTAMDITLCHQYCSSHIVCYVAAAAAYLYCEHCFIYDNGMLYCCMFVLWALLHILYAVLPHVCAMGTSVSYIYCMLYTAACFVARHCFHILFSYCVLPLVCAVGTAVLCACMLYCHMLCTMGTAALCIACDVLVPQIYCNTVPVATSCWCCACVQHCFMWSVIVELPMIILIL